LRIAVCDTGIGIEAEMLPKLFAPFEQGGREITQRFGGLGLGLAISKALVEAHGGTIAARSDGPGCGAMFVVELPDPQPSAAGGDVPQGGAGAALRRLRILLVEDHADTARMLSRALTRSGHDVATAGDVAQAVELAGYRSFDV